MVIFAIITFIILFIAFRKNIFNKNYSRNNLSLVQDPATATLLNKANGFPLKTLQCTPGNPLNLYIKPGLGPTMVGPPQAPVRPMAYTPFFQGHPQSTLESIVNGCDTECTEMSTFHPESPSIIPGTIGRGVVVCNVAPSLLPVSSCGSDCDSLHKNPWNGHASEFLSFVPFLKGEET